MKKLMTFIAALGLATSVNFAANADQNGNASKAGPLVNCSHSDGKTSYVPTMVCTKSGGTFVRNWGEQF